jgi:hypothetical protein
MSRQAQPLQMMIIFVVGVVSISDTCIWISMVMLKQIITAAMSIYESALMGN